MFYLFLISILPLSHILVYNRNCSFIFKEEYHSVQLFNFSHKHGFSNGLWFNKNGLMDFAVSKFGFEF